MIDMIIFSPPDAHRHFDKDRSGKLEHQEFKSCLRSLGYDIALMEGGETDPEFEAILDQVDPNRSVEDQLVESSCSSVE